MQKNKLAFLSFGGLPLAVGVGLLPLAILGGFFYAVQLPPSASQWPNWFANYDNGYVARGLLGTLLRFFHGPPTIELINRVVPNWEAAVILSLTTLFWALLVTPIFLRKFTLPAKWLLLSFVAVILLSPVWRDTTFDVGYCDEWLALFALFGLIGIIAKRPIVYLLCILPSFLLHPAALFYIVLLSGLILHAILRVPGYAAQWRMWLSVIAAPFLLMLLLYFLRSPEAILAVLDTLQRQYEVHPYGEDYPRAERVEYTDPAGTIRPLLSTIRELWWESVIAGVVVFGFPSLIFSLLFATSMVKWMRYESSRIPYSWPLPPSVAKFLSRYDVHIILVGGAFVWSPIFYIVPDWSRYFNWSWWSIGLTVAYFIWTSDGDAHQPAKSRKRLKKQHPQLLSMQKGVTVLLFVWAYTFLGAPLNVAFVVTPKLFQCQRWCIFPLTVNPLGTWYSQGIYNILLNALNPTVRGDGEDLWNLRWALRGLLEHKDGRLIIPADFEGVLMHHHRTLPAQRAFVFTLRHESDGVPPVALKVNEQSLRPTQQSAEQTVWKFNTPATTIYNLVLRSEGGKAFTISEFSLGFEN